MCFYWGMASVWPLYHTGLIGGVLQRWLSFWKVLPSPQRNSEALSVTIRFLVTSLTKALLPWLVSLAKRPALGRVLVVPDFFYPLCSWGSSMLQKCFGTLPQTCASTQSCFRDLRSLPFQIMSNQSNLPQVDSNQVVETSPGWSTETGCTWAQCWVLE